VSIILNIDTAVETASICLAEDGKPLATKSNPNSKESAGWLHLAISDLLREKNLQLSQLAAVAISAGPGSYTGLRVGMSAAKGICYSLKIPLITINTLQMMAAAAQGAEYELLCPMIDARRMEVFTAVFDQQLNELQPSTNMILGETSFDSWLNKTTILFFGNGSLKFKPLVQHVNAGFHMIDFSAINMSELSHVKFRNTDFASLAYSEPFYGKDFHSIIPNS